MRTENKPFKDATTERTPIEVNLGKNELVSYEDTQMEVQTKMNEVRLAMRQSPQVQMISKQLDVQNTNEILAFGQEPATEISKFADRILSTMNRTDMEDSTEMLKQLRRIMQKFDKNEFENINKGVLSKLFNNGKKQVEKLFGKYQSMGKEIDVVYSQIEGYRQEMEKSNDMLENLYSNMFRFYEDLEKYIVAGEIVLEELKSEDLPHWEQRAQSGRQEDILMLEKVRGIIETMEQRVYDLEMAKMVAFQTAPQIRLMQRSNTKLIGKIHSAFVVTIPIFKTNLIQAITLKRSQMVNDSLNALEEDTNRLLSQNAQNTMDQAILIARQANNPMIRIETVENNMNIILNGLQEVKALEDERSQLRKDGVQRLHQLTDDFEKKRLKG